MADIGTELNEKYMEGNIIAPQLQTQAYKCSSKTTSSSSSSSWPSRPLKVHDWLSMVLRLRQHNIGYTADGFYRSDDLTNSVKALKESG